MIATNTGESGAEVGPDLPVAVAQDKLEQTRARVSRSFVRWGAPL
jgi:hypothetical protein